MGRDGDGAIPFKVEAFKAVELSVDRCIKCQAMGHRDGDRVGGGVWSAHRMIPLSRVSAPSVEGR